MKQFISFIKKEFYHITRDVRTMLMLLLMPVAQLMIFGFAITTEINNIPFVVLDKSKTIESQRLVDRMDGSKYFTLQKQVQSDEEIEKTFQTGESKLAIVIPPDFGDEMLHSSTTDIQLIADASDPNEASTVINYAQQIIAQYQQDLTKTSQIPYLISTQVKMLYNPQMKSAYNFVPGIMGLILMLICAMMTSISIVREKEQGTMEILLVSPLKPMNIVLAKAIPYLLISLIDVISILILSVFVMDVPIAGNLLLLLLLCMVFIFSTLSLGLLISSITETQQAAMLISGVGLMLPTLLLSGLIFPIENMPLPLRVISNVVPAKWFIMAVKDVMIRGLGLFAIWKECLILLSMTVFLLLVSIRMFKNRL